MRRILVVCLSILSVMSLLLVWAGSRQESVWIWPRPKQSYCKPCIWASGGKVFLVATRCQLCGHFEHAANCSGRTQVVQRGGAAINWEKSLGPVALRDYTFGALRGIHLHMPTWVPATFLAIYPAIYLVRGALKMSIRPRRGQCIRCGYDLREDRIGQCPECGAQSRVTR